LLLLLGKAAARCNTSLCPAYFLSDGFCDPECNTLDCKLDSSRSEITKPYFPVFESGDCLYDCLKVCTKEQLTNGSCDSECNVAECAYDLADCSFCEVGCTKDMLRNGECDDNCNNRKCNFDEGDCLCSTGCTEALLANSVCDTECDTIACQYDNWKCACAIDCPKDFLADGSCDNECNNISCLFDNGDCSCNDLCTYSLLSNNECDEACNTYDCGYDNYKCTCADGCTKEKLSNYECDSACGVASCNFDGQRCQCSSGCNWDDIGDGVCDTACDTAACKYDGGDCRCAENCKVEQVGDSTCQDDCYLKECEWDINDCNAKFTCELCNPTLYENSVCDYECDFESCNYDNGKCLCSAGCTPSLLTNDACDDACNNDKCSYDLGKCAYCAAGCSKDNYGNGTCDDECNVQSCDYDFTDCCLPSCTGKSACDLDCLFSECKYDEERCTDTFLRDAALYSQLLNADFGHKLNLDDCYSEDSSCSLTNLKAFHAGTNTAAMANTCKPDSCLAQFGQGVCCQSDTNCDLCTSGGRCLKCKSDYYQFYDTCVTECPIGYKEHTKVAKLCYPLTDTSSEENPMNLFVSATETGDNYFATLQEALASAYMEYTTIYLTDAETAFDELTDEQLDKYQTEDKLKPLNKEGVTYKRVEITTNYCNRKKVNQCIAESSIAVIYIMNPQIQLQVKGFTLAFTAVTINGSRSFSSSCSANYCSYCPWLTEYSGSYYTDQYIEYETKPEVGCVTDYQVMALSFIVSDCLGIVELSFSSVVNCRQGYGGFINAKGKIDIQSTTFSNILGTGAKLSAFIVQECSSCSVEVRQCTFTFEGRSVELLNNGYEYKSAIAQSGFYYGDSVIDVTIKSVTFSTNIALMDSATSTSEAVQHLIYIKTGRRPIIIEKCTFSKNIIYGGLIYIQNRDLVYRRFFNEDGILAESKWTHIKIISCKFEYNVAQYAIYVQMGKQMVNVSITRSSFKNSFFYNSMVVVDHTTDIKAIEKSGGSNNYIIDGNKVNLYLKPRFFTFMANKIEETYWFDAGIKLVKLVNITIRKTDFKKSGSYEGETANFAFNQIIAETEEDKKSYMKYEPELSATAVCDSTISLESCSTAEFYKMNFDEVTCKGTAGIRANLHDTNLVLKSINANTIVSKFANGGFFDFQNMAAAGVIGNDITVNKLKNEVGYGVMYVTKCAVMLDDVEIYDSEAALTVGLYLNSMDSVQISNSKFSNLTSKSGFGACIVSTFNSATDTFPIFDVKSTTFTQCIAKSYSGGGIYLSFSLYPLLLLIDNCQFTDNTAEDGGSSIVIENTLKLDTGSSIRNCNFDDNTDETKGTISFDLSSGLSIDNCKFTDHNNAGAVMALVFSSFGSYLTISNSSFKDNDTFNIIDVAANSEESTLTMTNVSFDKNTVTYVVDSLKMNLIVKNSIFNLNSGCSRFFATLSNFSDTKFIKNTSSGPAGAVDLYETSQFICTKCEFTQNTSQSGGAIRVDSKSLIKVSDSTFTGNSAKESGGVIYMINSRKDNLISNSSITGNSVVGAGIIMLIESSLTLSKLTFNTNKSTNSCPGIVTQSSTITITDSNFSSQEAKSNSMFSLTAGSTGTFTNTKFSSAKATVDGGIGEVLSSILTVKGCSFTDVDSGPGAMLNLIQTTSTFENCSVSKIKTTSVGSFLSTKLGTLNIKGTVVSDFKETAIITANTDTITLTDSTFERGTGLKFTVFIASNFVTFTADRLTLRNNYAEYETAGMDLTVLENWPYNSTLKITDSTFEGNSADSSAVLFSDVKATNITRSTFINNEARNGNGGAVELGCEVSYPCVIGVTHSNFTNNRAELNGGAIYWTLQEPYTFNNTYINNSAVYGKDVASFGVNLMSIDFAQSESQRVNNQLSRVADGTYLNVGSGQRLPMTIAIGLVDKYGQIVATDNKSVGTLSPDNIENVTVTGENRVQAKAGVYYFTNVKFSADPGVEIKIKVTSDAIDNLPDEATGAGLTPDIDIQVQVRTCASGEAQIGKDCVRCEYDTYSLSPDQECKRCPSGAICYGGSLMVPESGYWRPSKDTDKFFACPNSGTCLGSPNVSPSLTGECSYGFRGNKCQACDNGFSRTGENQCGKCPDQVTNGLRILGVCLLLAIINGIMVRSSLKNAYQPKELHSIYIKIFCNYLQLVLLTTQLNLAWPSFVFLLFNAQKNAATVTDQLFSFDCLLADDEPDSYIELYYRKLIIMAFLPLMLALIAVLYWTGMYCYEGKAVVFKKELIATLVVLFFLIHPNIVKANFALFSCTEIMPDELWLNDNLDIQCYAAKHSFYAAVVALPALLVWGVGVPTMILVYLCKKKRELDNLMMKLKYGFLFSGFRKSKFYWEFVIMYRKIIIICCVVFIGNFSVRVQALTIMVVISYFVVLQHLVQPYSHVSLNRMEMRGILCAAVTIYCGLYYLSGDLSEPLKVFFFVIMVAINAIFIYYFIKKLTGALTPILVKSLPFLKRILKLPPGNDFPDSDSKGPNYSKKTFIEDTELKCTMFKTHDPPRNPEADLNGLFNLFNESFSKSLTSSVTPSAHGSSTNLNTKENQS